MRIVVALSLLFLACDVGPDETKTAQKRAALSAPTRVLTLDGGSQPRNLIPQRILAVDGGALIIADEPWFSDGSGQPATFLGDFMPGPANTLMRTTLMSIESPASVLFNGQIYFGARQANQLSLWTTDGTFAGTQPAAPTSARITGINSVAPFGLALRVGRAGREWFATYRGPTQDPEPFYESLGAYPRGDATFVATTHGSLFLYRSPTTDIMELMRTDGTDAGTSTLASRFWDGGAGLLDLFGPLVPYNGSAWFRTTPISQLLRSDGSDAGAEVALISVSGCTATGGTISRTAQWLVLGCRESGSRNALLFSDGTSAGSRIVMASAPDAGPGTFRGVGSVYASSDTHAFFYANSGGDWALHASDGTDAGTVQVTSFALPVEDFNRLATRTRFFFTDQQGHPWASDGTIAGTAQLSTAVNAHHFGVLDDTRVVFFAYQPGSGVEPWVSDGTPAGTQLLELAPGTESSIGGYSEAPWVFPPASAGGRAWFACQTPAQGVQTCVTDGTPLGTRMATPSLGSIPSSSVTWLGRANNRLLVGRYYRSATQEYALPVLGSDGTEAGTEVLPMLSDDRLPASTVDPSGGAWVVARSGLWHTDGTRDGSVLIADAGLYFVPKLYAAPDRLFLAGDTPDAGSVVLSWRADAGLGEVPDLTPERYSSTFITDPQVIGNELYFLGFIPDAGTSIIATDGTPAGTRVLVDASPLSSTVTSTNLVHFGGQFYFRTLNAQNVFTFARFDPSSDAGVEFILPNLDATIRARFFAARNNLLAFSGPTLYRIDPVTLATEVLANLGVGAVLEVPPASWVSTLDAEPRRWGDGVIFVAEEAPDDFVVWLSDGTAAGTRRLTGIIEASATPGFSPIPMPSLLNAYGDEGGDLFIGTWTRETGLEPGALAINASSITPLADLRPGPLSSNPSMPVRIGDSIYFAADDGEGVAVFKIDGAAVTPPMGGGTGTGGGSAAGGAGGSSASGGAGGSSAAGGGAGAGNGGGEGGGGGGGGGMTQPGCGCTAIEPSALLLVLLSLSRARRGSKGPSRTAPSRTDRAE